MHRLIAATSELYSETPGLSQGALRHLKILRPNDAEVFELFDGAGKYRRYAYDARFRSLRGIPGEEVVSVPRPSALTLFACITKGSRWDWTLEKATEIGATRIVPVLSARTIVRIAAAEREAKRDRYLRIVEDAARQSDAKWLPEITGIVDFDESLALVRETTCFTGALMQPPPPPLMVAATAEMARPGGVKSGGVAAFIGPEGDFTPAELSALLELSVPVSLGSRVLRAETAAIFALSILAAAGDRGVYR